MRQDAQKCLGTYDDARPGVIRSRALRLKAGPAATLALHFLDRPA